MPSPKPPPENTAPKQRGVPFKPGQSGNPKGRPKGARNKLGESFVQALADDFAEHGLTVVERVRAQEPATYLKIIGNILPREVMVQALSVHAVGTIAEVERIQGQLEAYRYARDLIGATPRTDFEFSNNKEPEAAWQLEETGQDDDK